ncbi:MAG: SGNH/GDSL hydrolase family protein [Chloroflexia bacterium]
MSSQTAQADTPAAPAPAPARKSRLRALAQALLVVAITAILILGLLEVALRIFAPQIVPPLGGLFVADKDTSYRLKPGAQVAFRFAEGDTTFDINSQGLRESATIGPPAAGTTRVLCIGDSFAFGMGVNAAQAFPHLLNGAKAADGTSVESINAGVFGYGTDNEAAWLKTYGWALQPKIVLVAFFVGNDVKDVMLGMDKTTVDAEGRLVATDKSKQAMAGDPGEATAPAKGGGIKAWLEQNSHAYIFLRNLYYKVFSPAVKVQKPTVFDAASFYLKAEPPDIAAGWSKTTALLDSMRADARAHGAQIVVVAIPTREQVHDNYWQEMKAQFGLSDDALQRDLPQQKLAAWSAQSGTPLIGLLPSFQAAGKDKLLYFRTDRHWNADGHVLAAEQIRAAMVRLGLFK